MNINNLDSPPPSETFGQDASFRLDQPIGAMSISPSGRDVVLASREGLHIIDLDSPYSPPRYLPHRTPWEVADVQWSPFAIRDYWIVSTSNQKALVWNVGISGWRDAIEFVLHAHTRAITDINFSAHHPDILATCAVDSFVHAWDLRTPSRPAFSFSDWFAGATQVKWSRQDEHLIASSHDRYLHIWDKRKGAYPARTIEAHNTKIYGLDWNRFEPTKIVTCSLDKTIKFWNIDNPRNVPERVIQAPFPVWRARHTPFGWGLLAMPQRGNGDLHLYDRRAHNGILTDGAVPPVATFPGHKGNVKEFLWRSRGTIKDGVDYRDFQLVSWGSDGELRLHRVDKDTFHSIGYEQGVSKPLRLNFTRRNARYRTFRDDGHDAYSPLDMPPRTDSIHSHHPSFGTRGRQSTNIGMSKMAVAQFRGWLNGGKREQRTGMHGKSTVRQDMNPIAWMKNVKIASWDSDSLADEITQVGERFTKLEFDSIDISQRRAMISLQAPWGDGNATVNLRVDFRFPRAYPKDAAAIVTVHKTSMVDEEVHRLLSTEVHTISETYASHQRGCIEAIVRYLLREQTMEQIVSWLLGENMVDTKTVPGSEILDDLSSDSDDDNLDGQPNPSHSSANLRVPLAKGCGALWSNTGELVCFFPQKPKEPLSVLGKFNTTGVSESQSGRLFEAFGRLQTSSPARRHGNGTQPTIDDSLSDISDIDSTFSSDSSSTSSSESEAGIRDGFSRYGSTVNLMTRQRSRSAGRSNKSATLDGTKVGDEAKLNDISIHFDTKDLLPSQICLANDYEISGHGPSLCEHNACVAERASLPDIASVWRLAALILQEKVPLVTLKSLESSQDDITVIARRSLSRLRQKDSGIDLSFDNETDLHGFGSIRWGNHPLGSRYLVTAIFKYFEKKADIQMLAMLSCAFSQPEEPVSKAGRSGSGTGHSTPVRYQPSLEVANSLSHTQDILSNKFTLAVTRPGTAGKLEDHVTLSALNEAQTRKRNTASVVFRPEAVRLEDGHSRDVTNVVDTPGSASVVARSNAVSASTSPEESRFSRRTNSGVPFAASRASLNALAQSFQHSPPSHSSMAGSSLKKFSPSTNAGWAGSIFGSAQNSRTSRASQAPSEANSDEASNSVIRSSVSVANLQDLRRDSRRLRDSRGSLGNGKGVESTKVIVPEKTRKRSVKTSLHNQHQFDLDGHTDIPLLDPDLQWKYRMYRSAYADQLGSWGLFLQQAELLQFDIESSDTLQGWHRGPGRTKTPSPKLEITKCCVECGNSFAAIEKNGVPIGWHCTSISCHMPNAKVSKNQVCSICQQAVHGLSVPCLQCGHMTCYECAQLWFNSSEETPNPCPTGCGCLCTCLQMIDVPTPPSLEDDTLDAYKPPRLTPKNPSMLRHNSAQSVRSSTRRHKPESTASTSSLVPGPDTALGAMLALSMSRSRAPSTTATKTAATAAAAVAAAATAAGAARTSSHHETSGGGGGMHAASDHAHTHDGSGAAVHDVQDDLVPWSTNGKFTSLGRGIGGGLSRGLSNRSSDATIRRG